MKCRGLGITNTEKVRLVQEDKMGWWEMCGVTQTQTQRHLFKQDYRKSKWLLVQLRSCGEGVRGRKPGNFKLKNRIKIRKVICFKTENKQRERERESSWKFVKCMLKVLDVHEGPS